LLPKVGTERRLASSEGRLVVKRDDMLGDGRVFWPERARFSTRSITGVLERGPLDAGDGA
jgi:hypothetical protein